MSDAPALSAGKLSQEEIAELRDALALATANDLSTAEVHKDDEWLECPFCAGEGSVDGATFTNLNDKAVGVQFFGVGDQFIHNEAAFRALWKCAPRLLSHIAALEAENAEAEKRADGGK